MNHRSNLTRKRRSVCEKKSYNRREAYCLFLGIARYVAAGFSQGILQLPAPESTTEHNTPRIEKGVSDGIHARGAWMIKRQQVFSDSIRVKLDGKAVQRRYLRDSDLIVVTPTEPLSNGVHSMRLASSTITVITTYLQRGGIRSRHPQKLYI